MAFVFTYGSLCRPCSNHAFIENQKFVAEAATIDKFHMVSFRGFPGAVDADKFENPLPLLGELYQVDEAAMVKLDQLESNGNFYQRYELEVVTTTGECVVAWCYVLLNQDDYTYLPQVPHNDWCAFREGAAYHPLNADVEETAIHRISV